MSEWDGTPWGGTAVTERALIVPDPVKAMTGPFVAQVEYGTYLDRDAHSPQKLMRRAQMAYHRNPWIGTAETVVTRKVTGLPWHFEDGEDEDYESPMPADVQVAHDLLTQPQAALPPEMRDPAMLTGRNLLAITSRHMGLCNLAYWFLDQTDAQGRPAAILYVNPARVWPSTTKAGRIIGWVLDAADEYGHGGTPLELDELLPFYLYPPDQGPYGSGLYERVMLKAQITTLADQHAAYILGTGGRIAGIVSPKEGTIPEESYVALVREFRNVNEAPDAAKRTTILRGPIDFTQTAASPDDLELLELSRMNRDDILAVWGVPPSQAAIPTAAGLNSGDTKKADEAVLMQGAVHDRVVAIRETIQYGLLSRWAPATISLEIEEPEFDDRTPLFDLGAKAANLPLTNAERRELVGYDPFGDERDAEVWLPALLQPAYSGTAGQISVPNPSSPPDMPMPAMMMERKASPRQFLGLRRSVDVRWIPNVRRSVTDMLAAQRAAVAARVRNASPDEIARQRKNGQHWYTASEGRALEKILTPALSAIAEQVAKRTNELLKPAKADPFTDSVIARVIRKVGERIVGITRTTQDAVSEAISTGFDTGLSPAQIAALIEDLPAFDPVRAELVARTETMFAYNDAALTSYGEFGVTEVEAIDGDEDEECAARNGQTYLVEEAFEIVDHPNGTLDWVPVLAPAKAVVPDAPAPMNLPAITLTLPEFPTPVVNVEPASISVSPVIDTGAFTKAIDRLEASLQANHANLTAVLSARPPVARRIVRDADGRITGLVEE